MSAFHVLLYKSYRGDAEKIVDSFRFQTRAEAVSFVRECKHDEDTKKIRAHLRKIGFVSSERWAIEPCFEDCQWKCFWPDDPFDL